MKNFFTRAAAVSALSLFALAAPSFGAQTQVRQVKPMPIPSPHMPREPLHTEFTVEVNHMGQIVKVKSGKESKNPTFNAQTYGNVLQMWIRHPDGSAQTGMYRVMYDYNPSSHKVHRGVALLSIGGEWANDKSAVQDMLEVDARNRERHRSIPLPDLSKIMRPTPTPKPKH
ncbi:MAG: hypothetical protein DLM50_00755 [Candidatus Meridianibacter frigidus]|nr:MAG: hypothetical protein DLM50_00755 [Candidatus Eremiobacteraeota bacterium]